MRPQSQLRILPGGVVERPQQTLLSAELPPRGPQRTENGAVLILHRLLPFFLPDGKISSGNGRCLGCHQRHQPHGLILHLCAARWTWRGLQVVVGMRFDAFEGSHPLLIALMAKDVAAGGYQGSVLWRVHCVVADTAGGGLEELGELVVGGVDTAALTTSGGEGPCRRWQRRRRIRFATAACCRPPFHVCVCVCAAMDLSCKEIL